MSDLSLRAGIIIPLLLATLLAFHAHTIAQPSQAVRFAVIGDYGWTGQAEADVATLVNGWNPQFVVTTGDNNYEDGSASTIDVNIGQYYHQYISPYTGAYGAGDTVNRFFPSLGNHDWRTPGAQPYLNYFSLPGNERYYDVVAGSVQFFFLDSDTLEPDGTSSSSIQAQWLQARLSTSTARWKIVIFHHPPYTSGTTHGPTARMQWPFRQWGVTAVLCGHEHIYERIVIDNVLYIVNGLGGRSLYPVGPPIAGSEFRYNSNYGAQLVTASDDSIAFAIYNRAGALIDNYVIRGGTSFNVNNGWNLVSVPLTVSDPTKTVLYPNAMSPAFAYNGAYTLEDTLVNGKGYWLRFTGAQTIPMNGVPVLLDSIDVNEGWNMIGSIGSPLAVESIGSVPGGIVTSRFFGYEDGYLHADSLNPANGYWVKVNQSGKLILGSPPGTLSESNRIRIVSTQEMPPDPPEREQVNGAIPARYSLGQNYPNPFNPGTTLTFSIPRASRTLLKLYDLLGREIMTLMDENIGAGSYTVRLDGSQLPGGVYFYRIQAGEFVETKKALLVK